MGYDQYLAIFFFLGFQIESKLWEMIERGYAGFPKPPDEALKIDFNADIVRVINVVSILLQKFD